MAKFWQWLLLFLGCALLSSACAQAAAESSVSFVYPRDDTALTNPLIGHVVWANDVGERQQPFTLVYADLTWREFEPEPGVYDFEAFEARTHLEHWRALGKRIVFRFVMDVPGKKAHRDIPDWLYELTQGDGEDYKTSYGRGYSPNYENPALIQAHERAIQALADRYGNDKMFSCIELGSLGHWGEWHVHEKLPAFPPREVYELYARHYLNAFGSEKLLMRRPFAIAAQEGMGLYNDSAAVPSATEEWLQWIAHGGMFNQTGEEGALTPMPEAWRKNPVGGEVGTAADVEELLGLELDVAKELFTRSHASWIGPNGFASIEAGGPLQNALDEFMLSVGYRLRVEQADFCWQADGKLRVRLTWRNDGNAPFYPDWPVQLRLSYPDGSTTALPLPMRLREVQPGNAYSVETLIGLGDLVRGEFALELGILDPLTGDAGVALAMCAPRRQCWYELARFNAF